MSTSNRKKLERQRKHATEKAIRLHERTVGVKPARKPYQRKPQGLASNAPDYSKNYRETPVIPSNESTTSANSTAKRDSTFYTGDFLIGLTTLHKSNAIPVTRDDDPSIFAKMRRG